RKKLEIRQQFLMRKINASTAELRVLETEAEQRQKALAPQVALARKQSENTAAQVPLGTKSYMEQAEAAMHVEELEMEVAKANLDRARVRKQLEQPKKGK